MKPRRPHQTGPPGFAHDSPRTPNVHISGPPALQTPPNSTKGHQEKERRKKIVAGGGKKSAKFWASHPSGLHPSRTPTLCHPKIQHPAEVEIGRTREKKLAEVEIGRSRSRSELHLPGISTDLPIACLLLPATFFCPCAPPSPPFLPLPAIWTKKKIKQDKKTGQ